MPGSASDDGAAPASASVVKPWEEPAAISRRRRRLPHLRSSFERLRSYCSSSIVADWVQPHRATVAHSSRWCSFAGKQQPPRPYRTEPRHRAHDRRSGHSRDCCGRRRTRSKTSACHRSSPCTNQRESNSKLGRRSRHRVRHPRRTRHLTRMHRERSFRCSPWQRRSTPTRAKRPAIPRSTSSPFGEKARFWDGSSRNALRRPYTLPCLPAKSAHRGDDLRAPGPSSLGRSRRLERPRTGMLTK